MRARSPLPQKPKPWPYDFSRLTAQQLQVVDVLLDRDDRGERLSEEENQLLDTLFALCSTREEKTAPVRRAWSDALEERSPRAPYVDPADRERPGRETPTQAEIAASLGCSRQSVAQTEQRALRRLKRWAERAVG